MKPSSKRARPKRDPGPCKDCGLSLDENAPEAERCTRALYPRAPRCPSAVIGCLEAQLAQARATIAERDRTIAQLRSYQSAEYARRRMGL